MKNSLKGMSQQIRESEMLHIRCGNPESNRAALHERFPIDWWWRFGDDQANLAAVIIRARVYGSGWGAVERCKKALQALDMFKTAPEVRAGRMKEAEVLTLTPEDLVIGIPCPQWPMELLEPFKIRGGYEKVHIR